MKKVIASLLSAVMITGALAACGQQGTPSSAPPSEKPAESSAAPAESSAPAAGTKLTMFMNAKNAGLENYSTIVKKFLDSTGVQVEFTVLPGENDAYHQKMDIALMAGDTTDIIHMDNASIQAKYAAAGLLEPLNEFGTKNQIDFKKDYGKYLKLYGDKVFYLPETVSLDVVFYNKKIFDDAGVPYPKGPWTWDQYIETAQKLTDSSKGIYGSFMEQYDYMGIVKANLAATPAYKEDGTSNFDDPAFAESLKWFANLGNDLKIQPSWLEMTTKKIGWDAFMTGQYGMIYVGSWHMNLMGDANYPHEWGWGVVAPPADEGAKNILGDGGAVGVNINSQNKDAAFLFADYFAKNWYAYPGELPGNESMSEEEYLAYFKTLSEKFNGAVTEQDLYDAYFDNGLGFQPEHIAGAAAAEYNAIILKEAELYYIGQQSLEDTVANIKKQADDAIAKEKAQ